MGMPKGYRTNINIHPDKIGLEKREELLSAIMDKGTFLPRSVSIEDMDQEFLEFVNSDKGLGLTINGVKVPVIFLTIQRWSEFSKTWQFSDKYKNIELPFITVVRKPDVQQGSNHDTLWTIPGNQTYTIMKVPTWDGVRAGVDLYKVPQPTHIDISYEVRLFTNRMKDLNKFNQKIQRTFQSRQFYINVNGHPMPLHLEGIGDESNIDDFEKRRFYVQLFDIDLLGYLLDEEDFEVIPTINRTMVTTELMEEKIYKNVIFEPCLNDNKAVYTFVFKPGSEPQFSFTAQYNINFTQLVNVENITRIVISKNGIGIFDGLVMTGPITIKANDIITIRIYKNFNSEGKFQLIGSA